MMVLEQFKETEGHSKVTASFTLDGFKLGVWVTTQRSRKDNMLPERKQRLDDIGFVWDSLNAAWEEHFEKLIQFKNAEGNCKVPEHYQVEGLNLGYWVSTQRKGKKKCNR